MYIYGGAEENIWEAMQLMLILFLFLSLKGLQRRRDIDFCYNCRERSTNWFQTIVKLKSETYFRARGSYAISYSLLNEYIIIESCFFCDG